MLRFIISSSHIKAKQMAVSERQYRLQGTIYLISETTKY